jgi:acyl carrier protein
LGRIDDQVKIRGFRIELGEIEAVLSRHPGVKETVVLARDDIDRPESKSENLESAIPNSPCSDRRLLAYVVPRKQEVCKTPELREFLKQKLPDYMVPAVFVFLDSLPLSSNGKVDRKALPRPDYRPPESKEKFAVPRTPVEELLANIWAEVLKLEKVGVCDNFFDLGGHSLLAIQVVSRIRKQLQVALTLSKLFEGPTVGALARHIELARQQTAELRALPIVREVIDGECPLSFSQERFWFLD